jgi:transposase
VRLKHLDAVAERLFTLEGPVARIATEIVAHARQLTVRETELEREITTLVRQLAPTLLALVGVGALTAAKIVAETADITRFKSKDAYARHNGTAPLPVWSSNRERHRLSRTGNRQLNAAIHRIAVTQMRCHPDARAYLERRLANSATPRPKHCEHSSDDCPTSSTANYSQTPNHTTAATCIAQAA